jgi:hypothetical protein
MRIEFLITKVMHTLSGRVIISAFPQQHNNGRSNAPQCEVKHTLPGLLLFKGSKNLLFPIYTLLLIRWTPKEIM